MIRPQLAFRFVFGCSAALSCLAFAHAAQEPALAASEELRIATPAWQATVEQWVTPLLQDQVIVGLTIGVLQGGESWVQGFGRLSLEGDQAPDAQTVYEIGSISKAFTGVLLADASLRGVVQLEDPVQKFMPEGCTLIERKAPIQLVHLANHTSGWPRMPNPFEPADPDNPYADYDEAKLFEFLCSHKPMRNPGRLYAYSNLGMGTLGHLLAREQKKSYEELMVERIAKPLGMVDTSVALKADQMARLASPYTADWERSSVWDFDAFAGAGGIRSTVPDMLKFAQAALSEREDMLGGAFTLSQKVTYEGRSGPTVGLGWHHSPDGGEIWHNGQTGGYHSYLTLHPERQLAVVVLSNTAADAIDQLGDTLMRELRGNETKPWSYRKAIALDPAALEPFVGQYQLAPGFIFDVLIKEGHLYAQLTGQPYFRLHAESPTKFFYRVVDAQITFELDEDGTCPALVLHQGGDRRAERVQSEPEDEAGDDEE